MQDFSSTLYEVDHSDRLEQKVVAPELKASWFQMRESADGDDRDPARLMILPYLGNKSQPIHVGYLDVQQD